MTAGESTVADERIPLTVIGGYLGAGKTTFLNVISGLDAVTEGKVWLTGKLLSSMTGRELSDFRRDHIGFIFQAYNLIPVLTVAENAEYVTFKKEDFSKVTA